MDTNIELRTIVAVLGRQRRIIIQAVSLVFFGAFLFLILATPKFTATALVLVDPGQKNILDPASMVVPTSAGSDNARVDSEVEILRSASVALSVIATQNLIASPEFGPKLPLREKLARAVGIANAAVVNQDQLMAKTLAGFQEAVSVRRKGLTYLISVSIKSQSAQQAAILANAISGAYIDQQVQSKINASLASRDILRDQIQQARAALASTETAFDDFIDGNIHRFGSNAEIEPISGLHQKMTATRNTIGDKQKYRQEIDSHLAKQDWAKLADLLGEQAVSKVASERLELVRRLQGETPLTTNANVLQQRVQDLEAEIAERSKVATATLDDEIRNLETAATALRTDIRANVLDTVLPPDILTEIYSMQQDASISRQQYQNLLTRLNELETQARVQIADSRIVSPALAPVGPSFPDKKLVLLAAMAVAAGLGFSVAFLNEYYIGGVTSAEQLSEISQAQTATTIPNVTERNPARLSVAERVVDAPLSIYSESVRKLRAAIDQSFRSAWKPAQIGDGKTILVTSALPAEGKSTTSLALARTYALAGQKTLLIDADLRRPTIHRHLGFDPDMGFLDFLRDPSKSEINGSFYAKDPASPLALILGSGRSDIPTDQLLNSTTFDALLDQARSVYDVIIIDSPPVLPIVDARYIAHQADAVVVVVKWASTNQNDLRTAVQPLRAAMKPESTLIPVLVQKDMRQMKGAADGYYADYSAAI